MPRMEKGGDAVPTDTDVIAVVRKEVKKREDSITSFTQANRTDLADKEKPSWNSCATIFPPQMPRKKSRRWCSRSSPRPARRARRRWAW